MLECEETQEVLCCHFEGEGLLRTLQVTIFAPLIGTNWTVGGMGFFWGLGFLSLVIFF